MVALRMMFGVHYWEHGAQDILEMACKWLIVVANQKTEGFYCLQFRFIQNDCPLVMISTFVTHIKHICHIYEHIAHASHQRDVHLPPVDFPPCHPLPGQVGSCSS